MINYKLDKNNIVILIDKSKVEAINGFLQTEEEICVGMVKDGDVFKNPKIPLKNSKTKQIAEHEAYLKSTDWITAKYNDEVTILGSISKADFIAKYQDVYNARQNARNEINMLEKELENIN